MDKNTVVVIGTCDATVSYWRDGTLYERPCGAEATVRVRYGRVLWTIVVCEEHVRRHTETGARVVISDVGVTLRAFKPVGRRAR